ncbi:MAG: NTP transferase domain-containing protein [Clostridiales bacterium]|jgi:NDP-sugar pyrophosphorylase family protein|nr:NTP transferase domain-containing protein [Clostridiales bacterium]
MNAVILSGGFGTRLDPLTRDIIKPMLTVAGKPTIDYAVSHLADFGISDYVFTLAHKPEQVIEWAVGYRDAACRFSLETEPLGTAGGVKAAEKFLDDTFIVMSGDALENIDLAAMYARHRLRGSLVTMAVKREDDTSRFGVVETDAFGTAVNFVEKPPRGTAKSDLVSCGVYIIEKSLLSLVPQNRAFDFARDLFPKIIDFGLIGTYLHEGYWRDVGDVNAYYSANFDMLGGGFFVPLYNNFRGAYSSYRVGKSSVSLIGASSFAAGTFENCIIGQNCRIERGAALENCLVTDGAIVSGRYRGAIIGRDYVKQIEPPPSGQYSGVDTGYERFFASIEY